MLKGKGQVLNYLLFVMIFLISSRVVVANMNIANQVQGYNNDEIYIAAEKKPVTTDEDKKNQINWEYILNLVVALISFLLLLVLLSKYENKSN